VVAVLAGLVIFPALFAFGLEPDAGPSLLFITMTSLFSQMPFGALFGAIFFALLILAAMTSLVAMFEVMTATLIDASGMRRQPAIATVAVTWAVLTSIVVLAQGPLAICSVFSIRLPVSSCYRPPAWCWRCTRPTTGAFGISPGRPMPGPGAFG
jgi:NSS family neurotransmitter:Na+ symporter